MIHPASLMFTQREFDVMATILHHVMCYNNREIVAVNGERLRLKFDHDHEIAGSIVIDGVELGRRRGGAA